MATREINLVITAANFPLTYAQTARTTFVNEDVGPRLPGDFFGARANKDYGTPQLIFCENVMPCDKGIFSVTFTKQINAVGGGFISADQALTIRTSDEGRYIFVPAAGDNYVFDFNTNAWASRAPFGFANALVSTAYVDGRTFICYERTKIIEYNPSTNTFDDVVLTLPAGYTMADIRGICGASNYLVLHTTFEVLWNAPGILTEFASSDAGAGKSTPVDVKAQITAIKPIAGGFVIYTARNAIGATFTQDSLSPFSFKEIGAAGGIISPEYVTDGDQTGNAHYIWGTNGLQRLSLSGSVVEYPEVTDFLTGKQLEAWNSITKQVTLTQSTNDLIVKLSFLAGRYLVISYGQNTTYYSYALVYDTALERWGKLKIQHQDALSFPYPQGAGAYTYDALTSTYDVYTQTYSAFAYFTYTPVPPKSGLAFMNNLGEIWVATLDFAQPSAAGVAIFGHLQHRLSKHITLQGVELDGIRTGITPQVTALLSTSGKARTAVSAAFNEAASGDWQRYNIRKTARNIDVAIEGAFVLTNALVRVAEHGSR